MTDTNTIANWPYYQSDTLAGHPRDEYLEYVIKRFEATDSLKSELSLEDEIVEHVTIEELLGALEYAHSLYTKPPASTFYNVPEEFDAER